MSEICPQCGSVLQLLIADDGQKAGTIRWCMACSYTGSQPTVIRAVAERVSAGAILQISAIRRGNFNERNWKRWQIFESLLANADADGVLLKEAYQEAKANPGHWVMTAPIVDCKQLLRGLLGLSWESREPPMALRCHADGASLDLAMNAYKIMPAALTRPRWRDLVFGPWQVHWVDR